eukprot:15472199-Alexandrium_andersonii.AAC.1
MDTSMTFVDNSERNALNAYAMVAQSQRLLTGEVFVDASCISAPSARGLPGLDRPGLRLVRASPGSAVHESRRRVLCGDDS